MVRQVIKVEADISDLVSNFGRAKGSVSPLTDEMKKAKSEGRESDFGTGS